MKIELMQKDILLMIFEKFGICGTQNVEDGSISLDKGDEISWPAGNFNSKKGK